jgi:hypothetical protein
MRLSFSRKLSCTGIPPAKRSRSRLREGTVLFLRLLQPFETEENFPVPYVVSKNLPIEIDGRVTASISRLHPKPTYRQSAASIEEPCESFA